MTNTGGTTTTIQLQPPPIRYQWVAEYTDGTELHQHYGREDEKNFGHIEQEKLHSLALEDINGNRPYRVNVTNSTLYLMNVALHVKLTKTPARVIYFRRITQTINGDGTTVVKHAIGLQATEDGKNYQQIALIGEDDTIELIQKK